MRIQRLEAVVGSALELAVAGIGGTPLQPVSLLVRGRWRQVHLKLEGENPCGSIKDRTALSLVTDLERHGGLTAESTLIESTSGNMGVALAFIARARRHPFVAVVDPKVTSENLARMRALGARMEMVDEADPTGAYLASRLRRVRELCAASPRLVWTDQYANPANPRAHYLGTGPEIRRQMPGGVEAIFLPVSTGGTLAGVGRYFRETSPSTRVIGVDALGSVVFGGPPGPRRLTGIGSSRRSRFVADHLHDGHILVDDEDAFGCCLMLAAATGIRVGGSGGAALAACARYLHARPEAGAVACVCPDHGDGYATSIFSEAWRRGQGLRTEPVAWIEDIAIAGEAVEAPVGTAGSREPW